MQVRRRGQTYYVNNVGIRADRCFTERFDSLAYLIQRAHGGSPRIEVHVWSDGLLIWGSQTMPGNSNHVMNAHPEWLTKNSSGTAFDGSNYWLDPGHPGVQQYLVDVALDVINNYDIDGFHYDYMRFAGEAWGYNDSVPVQHALQPNRHSGLYRFRLQAVAARQLPVVRKVYASAIAGSLPSRSPWPPSPGATTVVGLPPRLSKNYQDWLAWIQELVDFLAPCLRPVRHADVTRTGSTSRRTAATTGT